MLYILTDAVIASVLMAYYSYNPYNNGGDCSSSAALLFFDTSIVLFNNTHIMITVANPPHFFS